MHYVALTAGKTSSKILGILQLEISKNKGFGIILKISVKEKCLVKP